MGEIAGRRFEMTIASARNPIELESRLGRNASIISRNFPLLEGVANDGECDAPPFSHDSL